MPQVACLPGFAGSVDQGPAREVVLTKRDDDQVRRLERAREIGLFRYMLIREAADPSLSGRQRGALVRALAAVPHTDPDGRTVRITRWTLDRWILDWRKGGFDALVPSPRQSTPRTPPEVFELASALKKENPERTAAQIKRIMEAQHGWAPDERTLQRMFVRTGLTALRAPAEPATFGRFEAERPNALWTGDALHGPRIGGRKTYLFAFIDDHSRAIVGHRWGFAEDTVRLAAALRPALAARGVPDYIYVDNGSAFVDSWLMRACAKLGIKLVHSTPGRPQGRGKIERLFRTVNSEFTVEIATGDGKPGRQINDLAQMNRLFTAWVEGVYHRRTHSETGTAPLARWLEDAPFPVPSAADLAEAFRWSEHRTVSKTGLVSLHGNRYQVDPALVGRKVELVFDPFDLSFLRVRSDGTDAGTALPFQISRHSHPKARPEVPAEEPTPTTGIDYLGLIDAHYTAELADKVNYSALAPEPAAEAPADAAVDLTDPSGTDQQ
jgi:putative transposase